MNAKANIVGFCCAAVATVACAEIDIEQVFVSMYNEMNMTNITQSTFLNDVLRDSFCRQEYYREGRENIPDAFFEDWYVNLVSSVMPTTVDRQGTNKWLCVKEGNLCRFSWNAVVGNSTNCWMAAAREHGRIVAGRRTKHDWDVLQGVDQCEREFMADGTEIVYVPDLFSPEEQQRSAMVRKMKQEESWYEHVASHIKSAFFHFTDSQTFKSLPPAERNAIVSNLVETARFTPDEAARLGLTNVVEQVGGVLSNAAHGNEPESFGPFPKWPRSVGDLALRVEGVRFMENGRNLPARKDMAVARALYSDNCDKQDFRFKIHQKLRGQWIEVGNGSLLVLQRNGGSECYIANKMLSSGVEVDLSRIPASNGNDCEYKLTIRYNECYVDFYGIHH